MSRIPVGSLYAMAPLEGEAPAEPNSATTGVRIWWRSVTNRWYRVDRATNLIPGAGFYPIAENLLGEPGQTSYIDNTVPVDTPVFYRIGVRKEDM